MDEKPIVKEEEELASRPTKSAMYITERIRNKSSCFWYASATSFVIFYHPKSWHRLDTKKAKAHLVSRYFSIVYDTKLTFVCFVSK